MSDDEIIEIGENSELDECDKTPDSDCEIQEDDVPVIEVVESDEEITEEVCTNGIVEEPVEMEQIEEKEKATPAIEITSHIDALFTLSFKSEENFKNLKDCIILELKNCLRVKGIFVDTCEDEDNEGFNISFIKNDQITDLNERIDDNPFHAEAEEEEEQDNDESLDSLFLIDTTPADKIDVGTIPSYKRSIKDVLKNDAKRAKTSNDECPRPKTIHTCFNCFGTHSLKDCTEPRNQSRINKARKHFMEGKTGERYHVDIEQRFAHLRPGHFSSNLRKALGISRGQLPLFIYKMRVLGYPPGWLEEAKVAHSGIALFDSEGRAVLGSDEEEGELDNEKHKYDLTKIISYPGYNVDPGLDYFDEYKFHGVPPMQNHDSKEEFIKSLGDNIVKGYKRKKLKTLSAPPVEQTEQPADMEIEDIDDEIVQYAVNPPLPPPLPVYPAVLPPPPPPPEDTENRIAPVNQNAVVDLRDSPSLEDLEAKQKQLLAALENSGTFLDATYKEDSLIDEVLELENDESEEEKSQASEATTTNTEQSENIDCNSCPSPKTPASKTSKLSSVLGTPILKFSPYDRLPEGDLFKVGVSDVINFENLPDSTGKYEKIKVVIKKVRTVVTKLNDEN